MNRRDELVQFWTNKGGTGKFRAYINAKCIDCIYDEQAPGTWRKQVELCTVEDCPLYSIRPRTTK